MTSRIEVSRRNLEEDASFLNRHQMILERIFAAVYPWKWKAEEHYYIKKRHSEKRCLLFFDTVLRDCTITEKNCEISRIDVRLP